MSKTVLAMVLAVLGSSVGCGTILQGTTDTVRVQSASAAPVEVIDWGGSGICHWATEMKKEHKPRTSFTVEPGATFTATRNHTYEIKAAGASGLVVPHYSWGIATLNFFSFGWIGSLVDGVSGHGICHHESVVQVG